MQGSVRHSIRAGFLGLSIAAGAGVSPVSAQPAAAPVTPAAPIDCSVNPDPYKNYACLDTYLGLNVAMRLYRYHGLVSVLQKQQVLGQIARVDELAQETAAAQAEATVPPLQKQLAQQRNMIATLSGRFPSEDRAEVFTLDELHLPEELPVSLPSQLVEQRPDIRQAEENLHSASALVGVAVANRLPVLNLTAQGGSQANRIANLFTPGNGFWTIAGSVTQPIFEGGTLLHRQRAAQAAYDQAEAQYRSMVIKAFQNVADALRALQADADAVRVAKYAADTATATLRIIQAQLRLGQVSYLALLNAEQAELQTRLTLVQAQAARLGDTVALFQALGGGWWHRDDVQVQDIRGDDVLRLIGLRSDRRNQP